MGKKSGPPAPPPPPDYTPQRQAAVNVENARRGRVARGYNQAIDSFNKQFSGYGGTLAGLEDTVSGLKLGDDLTGLDDISNQLRGLDRNFQSFSEGDVSFLQPYDVEKTAAENEARYNRDLAAYKAKNKDAIARYEAQPRDGIVGMYDPMLRNKAAKRPGLNLPLPKYSGEYVMGFVDPGTGRRVEGAPNALDYGGQDFGRHDGGNVQYGAYGLPVDPGFQAAGTSYGGSVAYDMPTLNELNTGRADSYMRQVDDIEDLIASLRSEEAAEQARVSDFFDDYISQANQRDIDVEFADINDDFQKYQRELAQARSQVGDFDSVLDFSDNRQRALAELDELEAILSGRISAKDAEQARVDAARAGARSEIDELTAALNAMGIADADSETIDALLGRLEAERSGLRGFESDLDFDFANELADIYGLDEDIYALGQERAAEQARIDSLGRSFANRSDSLGRIADRQGMYNLAEIEDLQDALAALESEIGGTTSELATDFSGATAGIEGARGTLEQLLAEREGQLGSQRELVAELLSGRQDDPTTPDIDESVMGVQDIALSDEAGLLGRRADFERELESLGRFQGGTDANVAAIQDAIGAVDARLRELGAERGGIEGEALASLQDIRNREFFTPADVDAARQEVEQIRQRAETFGAQQAADELAALEQILGRESNRLAEDAAEVAFREGQGMAEVEALLDQFGNLRFPSVGDAQDVMTEEQLQAFLANQSEEDELLNMLNQTSFAQNLASGA